MKAVIATGRPQNIPTVYPSYIKEEIKKDYELLPDIPSKEELCRRKEEFKDVEVIFSTWGMFALSKDEIREYFPSLKSVYYAAGTVQYFARPFLELGIEVHSAWAANAVPVMEVAASYILLANKGVFQRRVKNRSGWTNSDPDYAYPGNFRTKVGLLGAGMIGKGVIQKLKGTDLDLYVFDPFLPEETAEKLGVTKKDLHWIFENCNVISNHLANNDATKGMIDYSCFSAMKKHGVFINTGRGAQTVEQDLIRALKEEPGRFAILDVTDPVEPPEENSELYRLDNVYMTPHIAGSIGNEFERLSSYMVEESSRKLRGEKTLYNVTLKMLETMA